MIVMLQWLITFLMISVSSFLGAALDPMYTIQTTATESSLFEQYKKDSQQHAKTLQNEIKNALGFEVDPVIQHNLYKMYVNACRKVEIIPPALYVMHSSPLINMLENLNIMWKCTISASDLPIIGMSVSIGEDVLAFCPEQEIEALIIYELVKAKLGFAQKSCLSALGGFLLMPIEGALLTHIFSQSLNLSGVDSVCAAVAATIGLNTTSVSKLATVNLQKKWELETARLAYKIMEEPRSFIQARNRLETVARSKSTLYNTLRRASNALPEITEYAHVLDEPKTL